LSRSAGVILSVMLAFFLLIKYYSPLVLVRLTDSACQMAYGFIFLEWISAISLESLAISLSCSG
jgi:hypothetical protein